MSTPIRWGILGLGTIARAFATGLTAVPDAKLAAVGSRSVFKAKEFSKEFGSPRVHGSYADLANNPDIDAIYIATPHPMHKDDAILCLNHGKAVLCEKPFCVNADAIPWKRRFRSWCKPALVSDTPIVPDSSTATSSRII